MTVFLSVVSPAIVFADHSFGGYSGDDPHDPAAGGTPEVCSDNPAVYEIEALSEGKIRFVLIDDDCQIRDMWLAGVEGVERVWTRVELNQETSE